MTSPLISGWEIHLNTRPRRVIAIIVVLLVSFTVFARTWPVFHAAWITRSGKLDPEIYERATNEDPFNADYHFALAQIYNYSTQYVDIPRAREEYLAAVRLNPHRAAQWLELSKFYEQEKEFDDSRAAMKKALENDPNYALTHWAAANLYIRLGDLVAADGELRRTADLDVTYLSEVLDLVWRFYGDPVRIMETHVPNTRDANLTALNYFLGQKSEGGTTLAWNRLKAFETKPAERFGYMNYLLNMDKVHAAAAIFSFPGEPPAFYNGSFETETLNGGFDWRISSSENAEARRDTTVAKDGMASEVVIFAGKENVDYGQVSHPLSVEKGKRYNLSFWMKTEGISTNEGMFVEVDGELSAKQIGTTYWQQFTIPFTASSDLVNMQLRRVPSKKFDNMLKGKVWLDAFELAPAH